MKYLVLWFKVLDDRYKTVITCLVAEDNITRRVIIGGIEEMNIALCNLNFVDR